MDRTVPEGGKATVSEQLQPVYETKTLVAQQTQSINAILAQMKVRKGFFLTSVTIHT